MSEQAVSKGKIFFILNPVSGTSKNDNLEKIIKQKLSDSGFEYKVAYTESPEDAEKLSRDAVKSGTNIIVAVGGDGTVNETARGIIGTDIALAIIPTGSGNGLARHLKIPMRISKAIDIILRGKQIRIDTATLDGQLFLNIAGVGFDAHVAKEFSKVKKRGFFSYMRIISTEYKGYKPRKYTLVIDGKTIKRKAFMVSFANSNQFGNNTSIDPNARLDSGCIDVCIVRKVPMIRLPLVIPLLFLKLFNRTVFIEIISAKDVVVKRSKGKTIHLDGEPFQHGKEFEIKVNPLSLNIIVP
ncbi:MAG: diacylglycerol kinase family lipid kinase [Bacteroidetes bacterium]|nr:diacylglycerol kinase family lipid kinase [Bacteroidota bacterium]